MENKICTSLEQSKKLIELGIDIKTADMCWSIDIPDLPTLLAYSITDCDNWENKIPTWSLAALLEVLPKGTNVSTPKPLNALSYCCWNQQEEIFADNPVDACVEMIIKLHD